MVKIVKYCKYSLALVSCLVLVSCGYPVGFKVVTGSIIAAKYGVFSRTDVNLKEKSYAAADFLAVKMIDAVRTNHVILAQALEEADHPGISSPLGSYIPEAVGLRFIELGYNVWLHDVAANGNKGLYPPPPKDAKADFILKGTYLPHIKGVDVSLRIIDVKSSLVVASFDYLLPPSKEVRDLSKTQTRIFRISE